MKMVEVKTAELIGPALGWAVAMALGWKAGQSGFGVCWHDSAGEKVIAVNRWKPYIDWSQGGPLIDKRIVQLDTIRDCRADRFASTTNGWPTGNGRGETILIASCRAIVAAELGDVVSVPAELINEGWL